MQNFENIKEVVETIRQFSPGPREDFGEGRGGKGKGSAGFRFQLHSFTQLSLQGITGVREPPLTRSPGKQSSLGAILSPEGPPRAEKEKKLTLPKNHWAQPVLHLSEHCVWDCFPGSPEPPR